MAYTVVCISSYFKGSEFMVEMKKLGNRVLLITSERLKEDPWPRESIDETYYMPEIKDSIWNLNDFLHGFAYLMRTNQIDLVIALDDFDVEKAALVRETFRIPGMGQTTYRYFRDKLAMREKAKEAGILIPAFSSLFNDQKVEEFANKEAGPWVIKPRSEASATGIRKIQNKEELYSNLDELGNNRMDYLIESFRKGDVYHVDSLVYKKKILFSSYSRYLDPPLKVSHDGGVFRTITLGKYTNDAKALKQINEQVLTSFGMQSGATHSEFIKGENGNFYFLETASRVGGANIPDMVAAATGINLWTEWARIENSILSNSPYKLPKANSDNAGLLIALAQEKQPCTEEFKCPQVDHFIHKDYHIGIVYRDKSFKKVKECLDRATEKVTREILATSPQH